MTMEAQPEGPRRPPPRRASRRGRPRPPQRTSKAGAALARPVEKSAAAATVAGAGGTTAHEARQRKPASQPPPDRCWTPCGQGRRLPLSAVQVSWAPTEKARAHMEMVQVRGTAPASSWSMVGGLWTPRKWVAAWWWMARKRWVEYQTSYLYQIDRTASPTG